MSRVLDRQVQVFFAASGGGVGHRQVEQVVLLHAQQQSHFGRGLLLVIDDRDTQAHAPLPFAAGDELERANRQGRLAGWRRHGRLSLRAARIGVVKPHDHRLASAIEEEVAHRKAQRAVQPEAAKRGLEVAKAVDDHGLVDRPSAGPANEGRDGRGHAGDRSNPAGDLLDVHARISGCYWHGHILQKE